MELGSTLWASLRDWSNLKLINFLHHKVSDYKYIRAKEFYRNKEPIERAFTFEV